jgi:hypothetical protein
LTLIFVAVSLVGAGGARGAPQATGFQTRPDSARSAIRVAGSVSPFSDRSVGLQWSQRLGQWSGIDVALGYTDLGYDRDGAVGEVLARHFPFRGRQGISMAAGLALMHVPEYGTVPLLQSELAYELRVPHAPTLLAGIGPALALSNSRVAPCPEPGFFSCLFARERFEVGDVGVRFRLAVGYSF